MADLVQVAWRNARNELVEETVGVAYDAQATPLLERNGRTYRVADRYRDPQREHHLEVTPHLHPPLGRSGWKLGCSYCSRPADVVEHCYGDTRVMCVAHLYQREQLGVFDRVREGN